jgi:hypothetical protein
VLPSIPPRAVSSTLVLCLLGCASARPSTPSSNDAASKDAAPTTDAAVTGEAPADAAATADATTDAAMTSDVSTEGAPSSNDAAVNDTAVRMDTGVTSDAPADASSLADLISVDAPSDTPSDAPSDTPSGDRPPPTGKVYAHSADTLYLLEPISKQVTRVGTFDCGGSMVDIAIDRTGRMTGSVGISFNNALGGALVTIDSTNAHCQELSRGPNLLTSLTYVPEGTLVANAEALVGYADDHYVRVDPATGALTEIGLLNNAASGGTKWISSGDVVSIKDAGTYLTVKAETGNRDGRGDRIVEVDPKTGALVRIIGPTGMDDVLGLGYWGGIAYGFTLAGRLIQIDLMTGAGTTIPIPNAPPDLMFLGAGTTTVAPSTIIFE